MICVGVDIGSCAVKAVAVKKLGKTFQILNTHFFPIPKWEEGKEKNRPFILSCLKQLVDSYPVSETKYIFCLPQNEVSAVSLSFPFKERYKIMKSLPYQIEEKLSLFDSTDLISDIRMGDFIEGKRHVMVFSVFKKYISSLLKDIKSTGIKPFIMTCSASAVANLFEEHRDKKKTFSAEPTKEGSLYLKVGHVHTTALFFVGGWLRDVCSFEWGAFSCIRKIANKYEIPISKAMEQFNDKAFVVTQKKGYTGSQIEFAKLIQEGYEGLIDKLRLFLLKLEGEGFKCKKIFICGGGAQVRNLQALISMYLNISVVRAERPLLFPKWNLRYSEGNRNNLIVALGSALEGFKKSQFPAVNFLKQEFAVKVNPLLLFSGSKRASFILGAVTVLLLFVYSSVRSYQSLALSDKANRVFRTQSMRTTKLGVKQVSVERVKRFIERKNVKNLKQQKLLLSAVADTPSSLDKLKSLSVAIKKQPDWDLEIHKLNIVGDKVEIEGKMASSYIKILEKNLRDIASPGSFKGSLSVGLMAPQAGGATTTEEEKGAQDSLSDESAPLAQNPPVEGTSFKYMFIYRS